MKRRDFLTLGSLAAIGATASASALQMPFPAVLPATPKGKAKNIIFMVADGMSNGTLTMADLLLQRKEGHGSNWLNLYREQKASRRMVDTAAADSLVTDSAAGASAWGCGVRVKNGALNVGPDGTAYKPILRKFQEVGKSVGCVTTVPITHATPAGFSVSTKTRSDQTIIADMYLDLKYDVMMGGGQKFFSPEGRKDKKDLLAEFAQKGFQVARDKNSMAQCKPGQPVLGVFASEALPYAIDHKSDPFMYGNVPTLAEMTRKAIELMSQNPKGFVLQVEGGAVDYAAHVNDIGGLLYDQIAFDEAIGVALEFAAEQKDTLIILTSDHGNANPGLIKNSRADAMFDTVKNFRHSSEWILKRLKPWDHPQLAAMHIHAATGINIKMQEAAQIMAAYVGVGPVGNYNDYKLPYQLFAQILQKYNSVGWIGLDHSADFVELGMYGPGQDLLPALIKNTDLHCFMLQVTGNEKLC